MSKPIGKWVKVTIEEHRLLAELVKADERGFGCIVGRLIRAAHEERFGKKRKGKT